MSSSVNKENSWTRSRKRPTMTRPASSSSDMTRADLLKSACRWGPALPLRLAERRNRHRLRDDEAHLGRRVTFSVQAGLQAVISHLIHKSAADRGSFPWYANACSTRILGGPSFGATSANAGHPAGLTDAGEEVVRSSCRLDIRR